MQATNKRPRMFGFITAGKNARFAIGYVNVRVRSAIQNPTQPEQPSGKQRIQNGPKLTSAVPIFIIENKFSLLVRLIDL